MKVNKAIWIGFLVAATVPLLSAKSYDISLDSTTRTGALTLAPGDYTVKLQGTNAIFTSEDTGKRFTAPVTLSDTGRKSEYTAVETTEKNGIQHLRAIDLDGSATKWLFTK